MIDQGFCNYLEYELTKAFRNADDENLKGFWCDGVLLPLYEHEYSRKTVNDRRKIITTAYMGKTGQDKYELTIHLGNKALSRYARGLDIKDCIPSTENTNWIKVDTHQQAIGIQLD